MDLSPYSGFIADPVKCRLLSVDAKRGLVCELSKCPDSSLKLLEEWTRDDIIQILCSELCKARKYEGVSKRRILHYLFNSVNGKPCDHGKYMKKSGTELNSSNLRGPYKRRRKNDVPVLPVIASTPVTAGVSAPTNSARLCENSAFRAILIPADKFCRRCSCCICFKYDDDKDPSLWLLCSSDQTSQEESCGLSCHLECSFRDERSGILQNGESKKLDGGYYCTHCGKQNDLLGCWKKQLLIAKDARRLDVLCHRIFLSHKILKSTQKYLVLHEVVDTALKKLEGELGPITGLPDKGRGIVGRLAVGAEVQKLCTRAIATLEFMLSGALTADHQIQSSHIVPSDFIKLEDISHESVTVVFDLDVCPTLSRGLTGFNLWHRKASEEDYPSNLTGIIPMPSRMLVVRRLAPCTSYVIKVVAFTSSKNIGSWEVRTNTIGCPKGLDAKGSMPVDVGKDPDNRIVKANSSGLSDPSSEGVESDEVSTDNADLNSCSESDVERCKSLDVLYSVKLPHHCNETTSYPRDRGILFEDAPASMVPIAGNVIKSGNKIMGTSSKSNDDDHVPQPRPLKPGTEPGSSSSKNPSGKSEDNEQSDSNAYVFCVKVIRWLESEGHIEVNFRKKFLTWLSLQATQREKRIVSVFVDTFIDDPASLAGQLSDTFSEAIYSKRPPIAP
ncbi:unnamed protein product [Alopecurus aequalis]